VRSLQWLLHHSQELFEAVVDDLTPEKYFLTAPTLDALEFILPHVKPTNLRYFQMTMMSSWAEAGSVEMLKWGLSHLYPCDEEVMFMNAIEMGHLEAAKYIISAYPGKTFTDNLINYIFYFNGNVEVFELMFKVVWKCTISLFEYSLMILCSSL